MAFLIVFAVIFLFLSAVFSAAVDTMDEVHGPETTNWILAIPIIIGAIWILSLFC